MQEEQKLTFEEAMAKLDEILSKMDKGEVPLEESMKNFEEGMKLIAHCEALLDSYERRITKLTGYGEEVPLQE